MSAILPATAIAGPKGTHQSRKSIMNIYYEGFVDLGRVKIEVSKLGTIKVEYQNHPMVISKVKPWKKERMIGKERVNKLFQVVQSKEVSELKLAPFDLMPGQDITIQTVRVFDGFGSPIYDFEFLDTPAQLKPLMIEVRSLYEEVKSK